MSHVKTVKASITKSLLYKILRYNLGQYTV